MMEYEINEETLALIAVGEECTEVYEQNQIFYVNKNVNEVMEDSCLYFGSTLEGRVKGTERLIGIHYKTPVIVEESSEMIFFPTCSARYHKENAWISLRHIKSYYKDGGNQSMIEFQNGVKIPINISFGSLDNQILRATRLESALRGRKMHKKRFK
ncbi:MAG: competence protein ComK [Bacilli bacterium]|nr:competence protein ComK [Bacilli bacterium]